MSGTYMDLLLQAAHPIATAPTDGTEVWVYAPEYQDLPAMWRTAAYHPDAGWCIDELREVTHWWPRDWLEP